MSGALEQPHSRERHPDRHTDRVELRVEHSPEQTVIKAELEHGSDDAAVDVGGLSLAQTQQLGRDLRAAIRRATTPASGGASDE